MNVPHPSSVPRQLASGYKGDAWTVALPLDGPDPIVLLDTGLDSVVIVRIPDAAWDRGPGSRTVHAHGGHDEAILITQGSGTLYHGTTPEHVNATRFAAPVVLLLPPRSWHQVVM